METTESIHVFMSKKIHEKGKNRRKLHNYILQFKSELICQDKKTILKSEFEKLNSGLSILVIYQT